MLKNALVLLVPVLLTVLVLTLSTSHAGIGSSATTTGGIGEGEIPVSWFYRTVVDYSELQPSVPFTHTQVIQAPATHGIYVKSIQAMKPVSVGTIDVVLSLNGQLIEKTRFQNSGGAIAGWGMTEGKDLPFLVRPGESLTIVLMNLNTNIPSPAEPAYAISVAFIPANKLPAVPGI